MYPVSPNQRSATTDEFPLVNWMGMTAADEVWCNSAFQRDGLLDALPALLDRAPDRPHISHLPEVANRCHVVPVGVDLADVSTRPVDPGEFDPAGPLVLWNQRWDHDKNPRAVLDALTRLVDDGVAFRAAIVGENDRVDPREFTEARDRLGDRVVAWGFQERADYVDLLGRADVVVSAAAHEFFGLSLIHI